MSSIDYYKNVKHAVDASTEGEERVEVNQRALIDKILARYASAGAVYRELLQNSNDAEATVAEIYFTTNRDEKNERLSTTDGQATKTHSVMPQKAGNAETISNNHSSASAKEVVTNVTYRNNGLRFRPQDWSRLKKIAEGNPDESKIGAFGVGAYTMFSICEEPMVLSGSQALAFFWKGDALWSKTITNSYRSKAEEAWTTFVLPSRDPYALPDLVEFGKFLCASLTFTKCLCEIRVYVNGKRRLTIVKTLLQDPTVVKVASKASQSSWLSWSTGGNRGGVITASPNGLFELKDDQSLLESLYHVQVELDGNIAAVTARYLSAAASTRFSVEMVRRMERVTKKKPPSKVEVQIFLSHDQTIDDDGRRQRKHQGARQIVKSFSPRIGEGRIFIGFRTSQTTGLAAHLAAPFVPTVEREAMDLQDQTLRIFNLELLEFAGIIMRLTLEHSMTALGLEYEKGKLERKALEEKLLEEARTAEIEKVTVKNSERGSSTEHKQDLSSPDTTSKEKSTKPSTLFGFAKFMAKGVTKSIKSVVGNISDLVDDSGGGELINPLDPRPLCVEENECILLMQSFCPRQSTPDPLVGTALAQGFSRCIDRAPPVLTRSGVVPGDQGRLPNKGMEAFVEDRVIRTIVYQNAEEYHDVIAQIRKLALSDLAQNFSKNIIDETKVIRLIKWWVKYNKYESNISLVQGVDLKDKVRFSLQNNSNEENKDSRSIYDLKDFLFFLDKNKIRCGDGYDINDLPMPESVLPRRIQDEVSHRIISDSSLNAWFGPLPIEIWIDFVSQHPCMTSGQPEYDNVRLQVLATLGNEYRSRTLTGKRLFGNFCHNLLKDRRCLPFDSTEPTIYSADLPSNLYLDSAELHMFGNLGNFHKVSKSVHNVGVSDEFLLLLGVRKSVAIDFLFENLHTLNYMDDPKPLVEYLRSATLTKTDVLKLKNSQYLPAHHDSSRMFAPSELYLPDSTFRIFPFVRSLLWPSEDDITERSPNGKFLVSLGVKSMPELLPALRHMSLDLSDEVRLPCLDFVAKRLGSGGAYQLEYSRLSTSTKTTLKFLPCVSISPLSGERKLTRCSVVNCYSKDEPGVMGFATLNVGKKNKLYGNLFQCAEEPTPIALIQQFQFLVNLAKKTLRSAPKGKEKTLFSQKLVSTFYRIFTYMSSRSSEINSTSLVNEEFIPCLVNGEVKWFRPNMVFFKSKSVDENGDITQLLFQVVDFSPFLASTGVRQEASTKDIFRRMIDSPKAVMTAVKHEDNYRALLRRVAAQPPFRRVTDDIRNSPFLLAYNTASDEKSSKEKATFELAKAADIFVIDNSFFGRMFPVKQAPHESDLEEFYALLGSNYISKVVKKEFDVIGTYKENTVSTKALMERIQERSPLLLSSGNSSRSVLVDRAPSILAQNNLEIIQAPALKAIYSLGRSTRTQKTTCCVRQKKLNKSSIVVTADFDWFDVGFAIGELILKRCQLEDAFFISSLLETPLEQLRARGFPVDRIVKPVSPQSESKTTSNKYFSKPELMDSKNKAKSNHEDAALLQKKETKNGFESNPTPTRQISESDKDDYVSMLKQMYPGVEESYLRQKLGKNPTQDKIRSVAEEMALHGYPKNKVSPGQMDTSKKEEQKASKLLGSKKLGKALKTIGGLPNNLKLSGVQSETGPPTGKNSSVAPGDDAVLYNNMERMLEKKVQNSPQVDAKGLKSPESVISIPEGLDHGNTCDVVPSQDITPFVGKNGKSVSHNGIQLFYFRKDQSSRDFMALYSDAVESFAVVMERLCNVFGLRLMSIAIYHDPNGKAIAFNSGGALYFNLRYFYSLHYATNVHRSPVCYSYWYVVTCHELAHNMEGPHNRTHAFYTESYATLYLPKLMEVLEQGSK